MRPLLLGPVLLFDGVCHLCHATVRWVAAHDRHARFRFASLESNVARRLLHAAGVNLAGEAGVVLVEGDRAWARSDAVLEVMRRLGPPWALLGAARILPRGLREALYGWISRHRYRWFGRYDTCPLPPAGLRERFLDADAPDTVPLAGSPAPRPPREG